MNEIASATEAQTHQVEFHGNAKEYFGIWIVNVLLTIITLGIYSAWAKVRNKKYFYGNTVIDGHGFDYHATGGQIFKGRLVAFAAIFLVSLLELIHPALYLIALVALISFTPWLIARAIRFNARISSFRNVRFDFVGTAGQALMVFFVLPVATFFTLYTTFPFAARAVRRFMINNHRYGDRSFKFDAPIGKFYKPFLIAVALVAVPFVILAGSAFFLLETTANGTLNPNQPLAIVIVGVAYALFVLVVLPAGMIYYSMIRNLVFGRTVLDEKHHFSSDASPKDLVILVITNVIVVLLSLGLMIPWARVRWVRYLASKTQVLAAGSLDEFSSTIQSSRGVIASEYLEMDGIDVGVGL